MTKTKDTPALTYLGTCPICKKGQIADNNHSYQCNHFVSLEDRCSFRIYPSYFNRQLDSDDIKALITKGETKIFTDFVSKTGNQFSAKLKLVDDKIIADFSDEVYSKKCPCCEGEVHRKRFSLMCENFSENGETCSFNIPLEVAGYSLSDKDLDLIFDGQMTHIIDDFSKSDGSGFSSRLKLNKDKGILEFSNEIGDCPNCKTGKIFMGKMAFGCSNYKADPKCNFTVWKEIRGKSIGLKEISTLMENGSISIKDFKSKTGKYSGTLSFNKDYVVQFVKD